MTDARPHLVAVDGDATTRDAGASVTTPEPAGGESLLGRKGWLAVAVALVCAIGWGAMAQRASQLEAELLASQAALASAEDRIELYQTHLSQVRERTGGLVAGMDAMVSQLGSLASDLTALGSLVGEDPTESGSPTGQPPARP